MKYLMQARDSVTEQLHCWVNDFGTDFDYPGLYSPADLTILGVHGLPTASQAEVNAGANGTLAVTPATLAEYVPAGVNYIDHWNAVPSQHWLLGGAGGLARQPTVGRFGVHRAASGAAATNQTVWGTDSLTVGSFMAANVRRIRWIVSIPDVTTMRCRVGLFSALNVEVPPHMVAFRYSASENANWLAVTRAGGTSTSTNTGIPVSNGNWYVLDITIVGASVQFRVNGTLVATNTTNLPFDPVIYDPLIFGGGVTTDVAANRHLDIDYSQIIAA